LENGTWEIVDLPKGRKAIGNEWEFKKKRDEQGNVTKYKARFVAKGFTQKEGVDFNETFAS
jgi:hypothetical protein